MNLFDLALMVARMEKTGFSQFLLATRRSASFLVATSSGQKIDNAQTSG